MENLVYDITKGNDQLYDLAERHRGDVILLDFYADWCGPCKKISPFVHDLVHYYANKAGCRRLILCKVNVDEEHNEDLCTAYKVRAMPTFVWVFNMNKMDRLEGADPEYLEKTCAGLCMPR